MKKPQIKIKIVRYIIPILLSCIIPISINSASALDYQSSTDLEFTFNPTISISISGDLIIDDLAPGSSSDSNTINVNVTTNNVNGYNLSATAGSTTNATTNLTHANHTNIFTSLTTNDNVSSLTTDNTWGYSYSLDNTNWSNYSGLPLYTSTGTILKQDYGPANDTVNFKIGAKASNTQAAGAYTNTINFTAIAFPSPMSLSDAYAYFGKSKVTVGNNSYYAMQDMTTEICKTSDISSELQVVDIRDNEVYSIVHLKDSNCWMTQNLRTIGTISAEQSNFIGNYFNISTGDLTSGDSFAAPRSHYDGDVNYGAWYNFCAASAGTKCDTAEVYDAIYDICPANWKIPSSSEAYDVIPYVDDLSLVYGGAYRSGALINTYLGMYWTSTGHNTYSQKFLYFQNNGMSIGADNNIVGAYIRCIRSS